MIVLYTIVELGNDPYVTKEVKYITFCNPQYAVVNTHSENFNVEMFLYKTHMTQN
jgi:hypothetical protein